MHLSPTFQLYPSSPIGSRRLRAFGGALRFHGPLAEKPTRWGMSAFGGKADISRGFDGSTKIKLNSARLCRLQLAGEARCAGEKTPLAGRRCAR